MIRRLLLAVAMGVAVAVLLELATVSGRSMIDFTAFYCAGQTIQDHGDPYRAQPLGACEARRGDEGIFRVRHVVMPAPLPPYALAPFAELARLPYERALAVWRVLLIAGILATIVALRKAAELPWPVVALALLTTDVVAGVLPGQPVPLVVAAIGIGAWALGRGDDRLAGAAACVTMLEPHLGLPVCLTLFLCRPRARAVIAGGAVAASVLAVTIMPLSMNLEFLTQVLPKHAATEIPWFGQYSLTHALFVLGASDHFALTAGLLSYVAMFLFAVIVTPRAARCLGAPGLLVALPPAAVVLGGTYIHLPQMAAAVPAALILAGRAKGTVSGLGKAAVVLLTVPGILFGATGVAFVAAGIALLLTVLLFRPLPVVSTAVAATVLSIGMTLHGLHPVKRTPGQWSVAAAARADELADDSWGRFVREEDPGLKEHRLELLAALPTWAGLGLLCGAAALGACAGARSQQRSETALPDPCRG
ncbi:DUF2029 domain-containing protein [bacterium]|nr:MAG: DUF2029 domain-containing protein [bacterium]